MCIINTNLEKIYLKKYPSNSEPQKKGKICFVTAVPMTIEAFLVDYIRALERYYDVTVITDATNPSFLTVYGLKTQIIKIPIKRNISFLKDIYALFKLLVVFTVNRFISVHSITPKAGLLAMIASYVARIPIRIHTFTGQVWATKKGISRWFLKNMDKCIVLCATHILTDSKSQREFIIEQGVVNPEKVKLIGYGSISGVDMKRFFADPIARTNIRNELGIGEDDFVFLFLGRLNREKGIFDLIEAFKKLAEVYKNVHLLIVGPDEENTMGNITEKASTYMTRIHYTGFTRSPERYMSSSDCICLPSYREGFGLVIIEAAACSVPAIGSRIYGIIDAIEDKVTGLLHEPGNVDQIFLHMQWMILHREERSLMGELARKRVQELFSKEQMVESFLSFYKSIANYQKVEDNA